MCILEKLVISRFIIHLVDCNILQVVAKYSVFKHLTMNFAASYLEENIV